MMKGWLLVPLAALVAFGAGSHYGRASQSAMVITSGSGGASYSGGFKAPEIGRAHV
jgi:hypothetical protein